MRLAIAVLALASFAHRADATPPAGRDRTAIAAFEITGDPVSEEVQAKMRSELRDGLAAGFDVVTDAEVQKAIAGAGVVGCDSLPCMRRIGDLIFVPRVVTAKIQVHGPTNVTTTLDLIDLATGKKLAHAEDPCTACTLQEVYDGISNAAASLKTKLEAAEAPVIAVPAGAMPPPVDTTPTYRRNVPLLAAGGAVTALGLAGVIVGIVEAARDQDACGAVPVGGTDCARHRDTTDGIIFGFAAGVPLLVAGIVMTWYGMRYPVKHSRTSLLPSVSRSRLTFSF